MDEIRRLFKPEFLNRIDEIMVFHPLEKAEVRQIADIMLGAIRDRIASQLKVTVLISDEVRDHLADAGYDPNYGARPLRRAIQNEVEDPMAEAYLAGQFGRGDTVELCMKEGKIDFLLKSSAETGQDDANHV
jgi:ATP-dependent Clp protease ATP-binding subunit ClpC